MKTFDKVIKSDFRRCDHTFDEVIKFDFGRCEIRRSDLMSKRLPIWTQSYKTSFGVITPFFGINYATFLRTNLSVEINAKINTKKRLLS
jgi:hypothetical protein